MHVEKSGGNAVAGPVSPGELVRRIEAVLQRVSAQPTAMLPSSSRAVGASLLRGQDARADDKTQL